MADLVNAIFNRLEVLVLGALSAGVVAYFLAVFHPFIRWLRSYARTVAIFWTATALQGRPAASAISRRSRKDKLVEKAARKQRGLSESFLYIVQISAAIGALYFLGIITVAASYWLVEPLRFRILECVYVESAPCPGNSAADVQLPDALILPVTRQLPSGDIGGQANGVYLQSEAEAGRRMNPYMEGTLDSLLNFIRLLRGTLLLSLTMFFFASLKVIWVGLTWPVWRNGGTWYADIVDENANLLRQPLRLRSVQRRFAERQIRRRLRGSHQRRQALRWMIARDRVILPQLVLIGLSLTFYVVAMLGYRGAEFEYSKLVHETASGATTETSTDAPAPPHPAG